MRLKVKEKAAFRLELLKAQNWICPLCGTRIEKGEDTLDHDHDTGKVRRVLHRSCNQAEGRVLSWIRRSRAQDPLGFLENLVAYWQEDYSDMPTHPSHRTEIEKEITKINKKLRTLKTERRKQHYRDELKRLKELVSNEQT